MIMVILLICMIAGMARGLMKTVFSVGKIIICVVAAKILSPMVSAWLVGHTPIVSKIQAVFEKNGTVPKMPDAVSDSLSGATIWFDSLNIGTVPNKIITFFAGLWEKAQTAAGAAGQSVVDITANSIVSFLTFIIVFVLTLIILSVIIRSLDVVEKLPVIKQFNRLGGLLLGLMKGLFINVIIVSVFFVIAMFTKTSPVNTALQASILAPYFYIGYIFL